jgi:hypothetical protein
MNISKGRWLWLLALGAGLAASPDLTSAQQNFLPPEAAPWAKEAEHQGTIPPGTVLTKQNYQQYKSFFPYGIPNFWKGSGFWKLPDDVPIQPCKLESRGDR